MRKYDAIVRAGYLCISVVAFIAFILLHTTRFGWSLIVSKANLALDVVRREAEQHVCALEGLMQERTL
jgi:hypothetical protein